MFAKIPGRNYFMGGECKTLENFKFKFFKIKRGGGGGGGGGGRQNGIYRNSPEKSWDFSRSRMTKRIASLELSREI